MASAAGLMSTGPNGREGVWRIRLVRLHPVGQADRDEARVVARRHQAVRRLLREQPGGKGFDAAADAQDVCPTGGAAQVIRQEADASIDFCVDIELRRNSERISDLPCISNPRQLRRRHAVVATFEVQAGSTARGACDGKSISAHHPITSCCPS